MGSTFTPTTPDPLDPSNIDRRGLVGVGELATPRWGPSYRHLRTPSMSGGNGGDFSLAPPLPQSASGLFVGSAPGRHVWDPSGDHLAGPVSAYPNQVEHISDDVMQTRREREQARARHRSVSHETPKRPPVTKRNSTQAGVKALDSLLSLSSLNDFNFDSQIESTGGLAGSLSPLNQSQVEQQVPGSLSAPTSPPREVNVRASAPPAPKSYSAQALSLASVPPLPPKSQRRQTHQLFTDPPAVPPLPTKPFESPTSPPLPGSARERIYARRASRQLAAAAAEGLPPPKPVEIPPLPINSYKASPPGSADSTTPSFTWRDRKTPPSGGGRDRETSISSQTTAKRRAPPSPSAPHHDILRHIAPKDFSHLPPSPSTASINQFLRGSSSGQNLSQVRTPPGSVSGHSKPPLQRSESTRSRSRAQSMKSGEVAATVEALRKLDGLGTTPKKQNTTATSATPRAHPGTPPETIRKSSSKYSTLSLQVTSSREKESPLSNWFEASHSDLAATATHARARRETYTAGSSDVPPLTFEKRESSPSVVGTPTSRDSLIPLRGSGTPPTSLRDIRAEKAARRPSVGSDISSLDGNLDDRTSDSFVPPVPPLPRGYMSMRSGLAAAGSATQVPPSGSATHLPHTGSTTTLPTTESSPAGSPTLQAPPPMQYVPLQAESAQPAQSVESTASPRSPSATFPSPQAHKESPEVPTPVSLTLSDGSTRDTPARRSMSKKWSFSSALSLKGLHNKEKDIMSSPNSSIDIGDSPPRAVQWPEESPLVPTRTRDSIDVHSTISDARSNHSTTPIAPPANLAPPSRSASKRLTPSSIPFFRRSSASSASLSQKLASPPDAQASRLSVQASSTSTSSTSMAQRTPSSARKSMLSSMHIPSMLRVSGSKRGISNHQLPPQEEIDTGEPPKSAVEPRTKEPSLTKVGSIGRSGRPRRLTLSSGGDQNNVSLSRNPSMNVQPNIMHQRSESGILNGLPVKGTRLPMASSQQGLHTASSASSLRKDGNRPPPSATPTKIPRMTSRPSVVTPNTQALHMTSPHTSMPPPALPQGMATSRSANMLSSSGNGHLPSSTSVNDMSPGDFGSIGSRQSFQVGSSSAAHRSHLLAPMSARKHSVSGIPAPPVSRRETLAIAPSSNMATPSRRTLPQLPSSATTMTISSAAKVRPPGTRRGSTSSQTDNTDDQSTKQQPIKTSKSFHTKGISAGHSRMSLSSSVGASRRASLAAGDTSSHDSPTDDDETMADAEMAQYVVRRKARAAASHSKKDDLSDLLGFPEDIQPADALTQRQFISRNLGSLSDYERKEVLDFDHIYYTVTGVKRPVGADGKIYNHGYDDERGDYLVVEGDHLCYRYEVMGVLGKGSFGQVVHCRDHKTGGSVAVKIIRNKKRFHAQALVEIKILQQIVDWDPEDKHHMVKMTDHFYFRGHLCIVTELLSINLYELIKANQFNGFSTVLIRRFTTQMLSSLVLMRSHRIVHCDLKPENILLRHPSKSGIKVIDFGSSCHESEKVYTYIQSRFYRSPEVILGMNYAMAIDMWSLGCILAELYTGYPIFPGENEHEQLACIMEVLGVPDSYIVQKASRRKLFFDATGAARPFVNAKGKRRRPGTKSLQSVLKCNDEQFVDFISKCLTWDPDKRLKPQPAMRHPWILAGRRRAPPPPTSSLTERDGRTSLLSSSTSSRRQTTQYSNGGSSEKKGLVISPPTPLVARAPQNTGTPRVGVPATARLHARNSTYVNAQKVSMA